MISLLGKASPRAAGGGELCGARSTMRPFFGFYGGKWRDTPKYYPAPDHDTIVEPFAGSAGYSVRYADRNVILGEKDAVIFGVWDYLIRVPAHEILWVRLFFVGGPGGFCEAARQELLDPSKAW